ncbi:hypothetical protein GF319_01830 [Candidatus Bathyarchaeota archaeon]|nr:hypothetical protein [Candidatus Bathyarchaeota archaeon]
MRKGTQEGKVIPCFMCRQPIVEENRFTVSWIENDQEEKRDFCGSRCLRDWADNYSENVKLDIFDPETEDLGMFYNVSAANLRTCKSCGTQYPMTLQECPKCGKNSFSNDPHE